MAFSGFGHSCVRQTSLPWLCRNATSAAMKVLAANVLVFHINSRWTMPQGVQMKVPKFICAVVTLLPVPLQSKHHLFAFLRSCEHAEHNVIDR